MNAGDVDSLHDLDVSVLHATTLHRFELATVMTPEMTRTLQRATVLYLTTYNRHGQSGTVPIWFFLHQGAIHFCTLRQSLKVRRIRQTGRVTIHVGRRTGPRLECTARLLDDDPALQALLLRAYRRRYPVRWLFIGPRLRRAFARGEEIIVQLTPRQGDHPTSTSDAVRPHPA